MKNGLSFLDAIELICSVNALPSSKKYRKSKLEQHIPWILQKRHAGWSYRRIQLALKHEKGVVIKAPSTIYRKIKTFYDEL